MISGNARSYRRYLLKLPWLKQGLYTNVGVKLAFSRIREGFENSGFRIIAEDEKSRRFCAASSRGADRCTCIHVVWIFQHGRSTYVSYGVDPRYYFFWLCSQGDHLDKIRRCGQIIRSALEGY